MLFERSSKSFWRVLSWCGVFFALWMFGIPASMGSAVSVVALILFIIGLAYFLYKDAFTFRFPTLRDADRRIEIESGVENRPLSGLRDSLANDDRENTRDLWERSRDALRALLPQLKAPRLREQVAQHDPYALRCLVFMMFVLAAMAAGPDWAARLRDGLMPITFERDSAPRADRFTIVITPPEYTGMQQMVLNDRTIRDVTLEIPQNSRVKALVTGGFGTPHFVMGEQSQAFEDAFEDTILNENGTLAVKQGLLTLASWPYQIIEDSPPTLTMVSEKPDILDDGTFGVAVRVKDDYGVQYLDMDVALDEIVLDAPQIGSPVGMRRSVVSPDGEDFEINPIYDLSAHPWAGLPVEITYRAIDEVGQQSAPQTIKAQLPERAFEHPVAKTLIALRKALTWSPLDQTTYEKVSYDARILSTAKEMIHDDIVVYMALRSIALRLQLNKPSLKTTRSVISLMWDTALRVEDDDLSLAARRLRDAQMALERAIQNPETTEEEIAQLMQNMRQALAEYMQEMAREMQKRMAEGEPMPQMLDPNSALNQNALAEFLDQMEQAMRDGDTKSAQEMLSQMQRLMDMMNPSMQAQMPQDMQMMQQGVSELQKLIEKQEELLGQTEKQADLMEMLQGLGLHNNQNRQRGEQQEAPPFVNTQENQVEQEALRFVLGKLMVEASEKIGEIPESMGLAEIEMRGSAEELGYNNPLDSIPFQMRAIEHLKESQEEMAQQLQQRMVQMTGFMLSFGGQQSMRRDPLGRPMAPNSGLNGDPNGSQVEIPDEAERRRVQEILEMLRRRAGDGSRPVQEREYYRRLLKRF